MAPLQIFNQNGGIPDIDGNTKLGIAFLGHQGRKTLSGLGRSHWRLWPDLADLQFVIFGKIQAEIPRHDFVLAQIAVHDYALHVANRGRNAPRRIGQMATRLWPARTKLTHYTCQTLCPVAGTKRFAASGQSQDVNFFERRERHGGNTDGYTAPRLLRRRTVILSETGHHFSDIGKQIEPKPTHHCDANLSDMVKLPAPRIANQWPILAALLNS